MTKYKGLNDFKKGFGYYEALTYNFEVARKEYIKKFGKDQMYYKLYKVKA